MQQDAPHTNATTRDYDWRLFLQLLKPSATSAITCILASLFVVAAIVGYINYQGSGFQYEFSQAQVRNQEEVFVDEYGYVVEDFEQNNMLDKIPVMVFWMFVGTLVYFLVTGIAGAISSAGEINNELHYVHVHRKALLREVYIKTTIRLVILGLWLGYIILFFKFLLPYVIAAAHVGAGNITTFMGILYALLAMFILAVSLHMHVIMVRLVALRPRLFSQNTSF